MDRPFNYLCNDVDIVISIDTSSTDVPTWISIFRKLRRDFLKQYGKSLHATIFTEEELFYFTKFITKHNNKIKL